MTEQQHDKSLLDAKLLQKIFIVVLTATYLIDAFLQLHSLANESRKFIELLLLYLIPVEYFVVSYIINSRKQLRLLGIYQSLVASVAAYAFWNTLVNLIQNWHRAYTANFKMYYAAAIATGILLIVTLCYLRARKEW